MAIITYPLNGITYAAEDAETYLCTRTSGVFSSDGHFAIEITDDRQVTISPGLAWINNGDYTGKSVVNTSPVALAVPVADGSLNRIDRVVLRFDKALNRSDIMLLSGTPASTPVAPAISRTELVYDLALYDIAVAAGSIRVVNNNITSNLLNEELCGLMRDGVTGIPTAQLQKQVEELMDVLKGQGDALVAELRAEIDAVKDGSAFLLSSGGTITGDLTVQGRAELATPVFAGPPEFADESVAEDTRSALGLARVATSGNYNDLTNKPNVPDITVDSTVKSTSNNPVSGKAVYNYALAKSGITQETWTFTLEDGSTVTKKVLLG